MSDEPARKDVMTRDMAMARVEQLWSQKHSEGRSLHWFHQSIEAIVHLDGGSFFSESEIFELLECYR